jgi:hypothetical protein
MKEVKEVWEYGMPKKRNSVKGQDRSLGFQLFNEGMLPISVSKVWDLSGITYTRSAS